MSATAAQRPGGAARRGRQPVWLFDLDNTLHDASRAAFGLLNASINAYIAEQLALELDSAAALGDHYWRRYGATLLGLERHHGVRAAHYLDHTHRLPGLEADLYVDPRDRAALHRLPGRKFIVTNAPARYAKRVLTALDLASCFEGVISIERMRHFGQLRPKPDARMFRVMLARLQLRRTDCVLIEDTLAHQRAAHRLGMGTVWMQGYLRGSTHGPEVGARLRRKPAYVSARIRSLQALRRLAPAFRR